MKESEGTDLIDFSSENDSLIVSASSSTVSRCVGDRQYSGTQSENRIFELLETVDADKVVDMPQIRCPDELPKLLEISEPESTKKPGKCNLRKSLAWDSAFFTSSGVLDPEELSSMIEGAETSKMHILPGIEEDVSRSTESVSTYLSDNLALDNLEAELFGDIRASIQKSSKESRLEKTSSKGASGKTESRVSGKVKPGKIDTQASKKVDLASRNGLKPKPVTKQQAIGTQVSGNVTKQGVGVGPQVTQKFLRNRDSTSSLPRPPKVINRSNPVSGVTMKRDSFGANRFKIEIDNSKRISVGSKGTQAPKTTGLVGPRRALPKPAVPSKSSFPNSSPATMTELTRSSSCDSSSSASSGNIGKSPSISARRKVGSRTLNPPLPGSKPKTSSTVLRNKIPSENSGPQKPRNCSPIISPASSISEWSVESSSSTSNANQMSKSRASIDISSCRSFDSDAPPALHLNMDSSYKISYGNRNQTAELPGQNMKKTSTQPGALSRPPSVKPSGLRLPSPKIGFFDGAKSGVRTPNGGLQSQSRLPTGLRKSGVGTCSPVGSSNKAKPEKLSPAVDVTVIETINPGVQKSAYSKLLQEPLRASTKISSSSKG